MKTVLAGFSIAKPKTMTKRKTLVISRKQKYKHMKAIYSKTDIRFDHGTNNYTLSGLDFIAGAYHAVLHLQSGVYHQKLIVLH